MEKVKPQNKGYYELITKKNKGPHFKRDNKKHNNNC